MKKVKKWLAVLISLGLLFSLGGTAAAMETPPMYWDYDYWDCDYYDDFDYDSYYEQMRRDTIKTLGGDPDGLNVMVNDRCLAFGSVKPVMKGGRLFVPARKVLEALGAQVGYAGGKMTAGLNGKTLQHQVGTKTVTVLKGDSSKTVELEAASYIQAGTTMMPVRDLGEALGLYVEWDWTYDLAVVIDSQKYIDQVDRDFTVLNRLLGSAQSSLDLDGKTYQTTTSARMDWTSFDSIHGNKTYSATAKLEALTSQEAVNYALSLDLRDLAELLASEFYWYDYNEAADFLASVIKAQLIYLAEDGTVYGTISGLPQDVWYEDNAKEFLEYFWGEFGVEPGEQITVGSLLWNTEMYSYSPMWVAGSMLSDGADMAKLLGDDGFQKSGSSYVRTWDNQSFLDAIIQDDASEEDRDWISRTTFADGEKISASLTVTENTNGGCSWKFSVNVDMNEGKLELTANQRGQSMEMKMKLHIKNEGELTYQITSTTEQTTKAVKTAPPENAVVMAP